MKTCSLSSHIHLPVQSKLNRPTSEPPTHLLPIRTKSRRSSSESRRQTLIIRKFPEEISRERNIFESKVSKPSQRGTGFQRYVILGAASLGLAVLLAGMDDGTKALALGPEGPLMEEFWDNMRRYGLYFLTVSTGVIYTIFQPILELLKSPISAILIITILGGGIFIVSQVLSAMVGVSDFSYDYNY
ncbi:hypothetical protein NE237_031066 [Protea cynaroides]|uniref:Uncharacterized protein ycf33 n=1 Tax=Protea cynaroides TaxID=273540 RepID=A0A9Q0L1H7_9MAGN|nr:hypothetical protein NE237_031066 [Protea cynaroides]